MKRALLIAFTLLPFATFETSVSAGIIGDFCSRLMSGPVSPTRTALEVKDEAVWASIKDSLLTELQTFSKLNAQEKQCYLQKVSRDFEERHAGEEFGAHYNLHGGMRPDYLDKGGISFSMGDSGLEQGFSRDRRQKVYFFNMRAHKLYEVVTSRNPSNIYWRTRFGNVLTLFDLKAVRAHLNERYPGAVEENEISFSLDDSRSVTTRAVPSQFYVTIPMEVFSGYKKRLGVSLSWDDESLVTMRLIEAHLQAFRSR